MFDTRERSAGTASAAIAMARLYPVISSASRSVEPARREAQPSARAVRPLDEAKPATSSTLGEFLQSAHIDPDDPASLGSLLDQLIQHGYDRAPFMPLPGHGQTLTRWRTLAAVAACDLGLVKLFEGHTDALAILAELRARTPVAGSRWAVWAAEPPDARVTATRVASADGEPSELQLTGKKAWCSGAAVVSHALITAWLDDEPVLVSVAMDDPSISIDTTQWQAIGMRATASADVSFERTPATLIGGAQAYVKRPGFWHGGAGIAACWYGAAAQIGAMLRNACNERADAHRLAHLGDVDVALAGAAALLRETAASIDANPLADAQRAVMRVRLAVEAAATEVMTHATRALGAAPLCRDARFARALTDLPVFLRQSHAERDLAALGELIVAAKSQPGTSTDAADAPWSL
ncbi:acyl-CoA/acyl-ACP dehydrogenase [Paraburkholderia sp. BCC1886]|uniref:acyl-CoA/acyl-ACP dehydrogenase n=1 Tax=Paraburkholderia sp. BCC1886 TaxID=2562670 RepID=UPI001182042C|nr:acyl-CoA/acyl-ACP dehydrogenase [Paraburkholderia sp. BCC1886]